MGRLVKVAEQTRSKREWQTQITEAGEQGRFAHQFTREPKTT
jgi:hypothetical protein